jgi:hypothetical protein
MINRVNHLCKQEAVKSLILPICCEDWKKVNYCGLLVATVKQIRWESRERNYADLKPYVFDKVHDVPPATSAHTAKVKSFFLSNRQYLFGVCVLFSKRIMKVIMNFSSKVFFKKYSSFAPSV